MSTSFDDPRIEAAARATHHKWSLTPWDEAHEPSRDLAYEYVREALAAADAVDPARALLAEAVKWVRKLTLSEREDVRDWLARIDALDAHQEPAS